jgi:dimethylargininase
MGFTKAITRTPGSNFAEGLTSVDLGIPDYQKTLDEHARYLAALKKCGLRLIELPPDPRFPDGTFVEDTAILLTEPAQAGACAMLTRPGAESRSGEVVAMQQILKQFSPELAEISAPGKLDGGDVCEAGKHFFIGISQRTNEAGARQLANWLTRCANGITSSFIDIRQTPGILHLKSGIAYIGDNRLVVIDALLDKALAANPAFEGYEIIHVARGEEYAANCIRVNDNILIAAGFPRFEASLRGLGYQLSILDMSEFQKMDGGLSCLSLRF